MGAVSLACSTLAFNGQTLEEAFQGVAGLGFDLADLGAFELEGFGQLRPALAADAMGETADRIIAAAEAAGIGVGAINAFCGEDPGEASRRVATLCLIAHRIGAATLTLPAGKGPVAEAVERFLPLVDAGLRYGVRICAEIHLGNLTERPAAAVDLVSRVPGLKLTMDPSHILIQGESLEAWRGVLPHVAHVHLRDAGTHGWGEVQVPWGTGALDLPGILAALDRQDYAGVLSVEYIGPGFPPGTQDDHLASIRAAKGMIERALGAKG